MTAIAHGRQTAHTASPFTWNTDGVYQTVLTVAASNFVAGGKYLLLAMLGNINVADTGRSALAKTRHGTTDFADSIQQAESLAAGSTDGQQYLYTTVFTQPGTAEDIIIQARTTDSAATLTVHAASLTWIRLDAALTENTDWYYAELATDDAMSAAWETRASITIDDAGDWLIIGYERIDFSNASTDGDSRIAEDPTGTPIVLAGPVIREARNATDVYVRTHFTRRVLASGSVTIAVQDFGEAGAHTHLFSSIFALNLDKFAQKATAAVDTDGLTPDTAGLDITPDGWSDPNPSVTGDWLMLGFCIVDVDGVTRGAEVWIEADGAGRDSQTPQAPRQIHGDAAADQPSGVAVLMTSLATGTRVIDFESDWSGTVSGVIKNRFLIAFSMELAAAGAAIVTPGPIAIAAILPTPVAMGEARTTPAALAVAATLPTPVALGEARATPAAIAIPITLPPPAALGEARVTPAAIPISVTLPTPVTLVEATAQPGPINIAITLPGPIARGTATVLTAAINVIITLPLPTALVGAAVRRLEGVILRLTSRQESRLRISREEGPMR